MESKCIGCDKSLGGVQNGHTAGGLCEACSQKYLGMAGLKMAPEGHFEIKEKKTSGAAGRFLNFLRNIVGGR